MAKARKGRRETPGGRERLLRAAVRLFAAKGYAATSVRDLLRAAGVTAPVLYYHFGSKEGVFVALVRDGVERMETAVEEAIGHGGSAADRIRGYCRAIADVRRDYADVAWIVDAILSGPAETAPPVDFRTLVRGRVRRLEGLVREGIRSQEIRKCDPRHASLALLGAVEVAARPRFFVPEGESGADQLDGMLSVILDGLAAPGPAARKRP